MKPSASPRRPAGHCKSRSRPGLVDASEAVAGAQVVDALWLAADGLQEW
jgi:hypothetical protein